MSQLYLGNKCSFTLLVDGTLVIRRSQVMYFHMCVHKSIHLHYQVFHGLKFKMVYIAYTRLKFAKEQPNHHFNL